MARPRPPLAGDADPRAASSLVAAGSDAGEVDERDDRAGGWGQDDGSPAPAVTLTPDLPADELGVDLDPTTADLQGRTGAGQGVDQIRVVAVRPDGAPRVHWCELRDVEAGIGDRVVVDTERGLRLGVVAAGPTFRAVAGRGARRVVRRAEPADLAAARTEQEANQAALRVAKDRVHALRIPLKISRVDLGGGRALVYCTSEERVDTYKLLRDLGTALATRVELRQPGNRDEAKQVGGIGACGQELCCTTWLPDFVPVSIKMAKDQGMVLAPSKVTGQCGRLKCCLVYEQATYAELRKGLPKLGKRVVTERGEGRVTEVDVLRQRIRVSYGPGEVEVHPASDVRPLFPPGGGPGRPASGGSDDDGDDAEGDVEGPTGGPEAPTPGSGPPGGGPTGPAT